MVKVEDRVASIIVLLAKVIDPVPDVRLTVLKGTNGNQLSMVEVG